MTIALTIIIGLVTLSVILFAHELGHFITAKASGVKVEEFGLGFPPRLLSFKRGETRYSLNAIPFGGFNKLAGEEDPGITRSLASKSTGIRLLVISAGSLMNVLLAFLLFSLTFMVPHDVVSGQVVVMEVAPGSPAAAAGIESGDTVLSINDRPISNIAELSRYVQLNLGRDTTMVIRHDDSTTEEIQLVPRWKPPEGQGATGITISMPETTVTRQHYPFWKAIPMGAKGLIETIILYKNGLVGVVMGALPAELIGPVGIVQITGEVAMKAGISPLLEFAAFISLILGIINLFPLPALDGGRIAFVLLEWVRRGKRISPRTEGLVHLIGLAMLMLLLVAITYQDIIRIISGESLIP